jgi:hypothetical protein
VYDSKRQLRSWLADDGVTHTTADIPPALTSLEVTGRIERPAVSEVEHATAWIARHSY